MARTSMPAGRGVNVAIEGQGTRAPDPSAAVRTVADIDLRPSLSRNAGAIHPDVLRTALTQLRQTVRADDRICPYSVSRIAVVFGPTVDAVPPGRLGARLARAVGEGVFDRWSGERPLAEQPVEPPLRHRTRGLVPSTTVVTVERVFERDADGLVPPRDDEADATTSEAVVSPRAPRPRRRQRAVVRFSPDGLAGPADGRAGDRHDGRVADTLLVIDPDPGADSGPGIAAAAATDAAERLGYDTGTVSLCSDEGLVVEIGGKPLDLVVLVIGPEPAEATNWWSSTWSIPARLTEAYRSKGFAVLAVSVGASLAAMTAAVEEGAGAAYDLSELRHSLRAATAPHGDDGGDRLHLPNGAEGFHLLTVAERRVLFSLTTGRSPQAIAEDLVVSLATVRSHIRSVLRKLGVRSQLAAVALATSRAVAPDPRSTRPSDIAAEATTAWASARAL